MTQTPFIKRDAGKEIEAFPLISMTNTIVKVQNIILLGCLRYHLFYIRYAENDHENFFSKTL